MKASYLAIALVLAFGAACRGRTSESMDAQSGPMTENGKSATRISQSDLTSGTVLMVSGRCFSYTDAVSLGPPPVSRSDWAIGDERPTLYVVGRMPQPCSRVTIRAKLLVDTIKTLAGTRQARKYLEIVP